MMLRFIFFVALCLLAAPRDARADDCTATMTDVAFGNVSPIAGTDYYASGTLTVTCTWVLGNLLTAVVPTANICLNLGPGTGATAITARAMRNGSATLPFNLYRDNTYSAASIWGGTATAGSAQPVTTSMIGLLGLGVQTRTFTIYGKIPGAALAGVRSMGGVDTPYTADFSGAGTIQYSFAGLLAASSACTGGTSAPFSFKATANVINDCFINTSPLVFGASNRVLSAAVRTTGALSVLCTAGSPYQIVLNGGSVAGNPAARKMANALTNETIGYEISSILDGPLWGDGSGGTVAVSGTGTGVLQTVRMYGRVPPQKTPTPGDYKDTVIVTLMF